MPTEYTHRPWHQILCQRLSPDGVLVVEFRGKGDEVEIWKEYNRRNRKDWAQIVDTEVVHLGSYDSLEAVAIGIAAGKSTGQSRGT